MKEMFGEQEMRSCPNCEGVMKYITSKTNPEFYCVKCHYSEKESEQTRTKKEYNEYQRQRLNILMGASRG